MKQLKNYSLIMASTMLLLSAISCSKPDLSHDPVPHQDTTGTKHNPPPAPLLTVTAVDTGWFGGDVKISVVTDGTVENLTLVDGVIVIKNVRGDSSITVIASKSNSYGTTKTTKTLTVTSFSSNTTQLCHSGDYVLVSDKRLNLSIPTSEWVDGPSNCDTHRFLPDGTGYQINGSCSSQPGSIFSSTWKWLHDETQIEFSGYDVWDIELTATGFVLTKKYSDFLNPIIQWKAVQTYKHL